MSGIKKKRQKKRKFGRYSFTKTQHSNRSSSSRIITKEFEIFVTDFLTDPCGLPVELKDCVLVDETTTATTLNDLSDVCSINNNSQVLKKIFGDNELVDRKMVVEEPSKKTE